jgi:predicted nucleotidyltransferase
MGAKVDEASLASALFSRTCGGVLAVLYGRPERALYGREISRAVGLGVGTVQRELKRLTAAGVITRSPHGHQVFYQANARCPIYGELRAIVLKTVGLAYVLRDALSRLGRRVRVAFVFGSFARGDDRPESDVDVFIVGEATFADVVGAISEAQEAVGRDVNPVVYPVPEFRRKVAERHYFVTEVLAGPKVFLVGDARELGVLAEERLDTPTHDERTGNPRTPVGGGP